MAKVTVFGYDIRCCGGDDAIARAALERVKTVLSGPSGCRKMRRCATETAVGFTWHQVAASLEEFVFQASQAGNLSA
jgi:hypothetical protein